jgi:hypothetical protein
MREGAKDKSRDNLPIAPQDNKGAWGYILGLWATQETA